MCRPARIAEDARLKSATVEGLSRDLGHSNSLAFFSFFAI
jgi:hypothetical protein